MRKKISPTLIGVFVLGAAGLMVASALIFGAGELFRDSTRVVTYFDGSVKGLRSGANVLFRGVHVGTVVEVRAVVDSQTLEFSIPVVYDLPEGTVSYLRGEGFEKGPEEAIGELIEKGLRAKLISESIVTGQLAIELDFHPDEEATFRAPTDEYIEIPSIRALELTLVVEEALQLVKGVNELVPELQNILVGVDNLVNAEDTQQLPGSARAAADQLTATLGDAQTLIRNADSELGPVMQNIVATLEVAQGTLRQASLDLGPDSELYVRVTTTLNELENTMRSLRALLDLLERHPEALIKGKSES